MTEEQRLTVAVARALCVADGNDPETWNGKPEVSGGITCDVALPTWENYVEAARAVIPVVLEAAAEVADQAMHEAERKGREAEAANSRRNFAAASVTSEAIAARLRQMGSI